jgi:hypothetical protein
MKTLLLAFILMVSVKPAFAQEKKIEIVCEVINGEINYGRLAKYLPENQQHHLFTIKRLHKYEAMDIVTMLNVQGWKLVSATPVVRVSGSSHTAYIMKNEISLTGEEYEQMQARMRKDIK